MLCVAAASKPLLQYYSDALLCTHRKHLNKTCKQSRTAPIHTRTLAYTHKTGLLYTQIDQATMFAHTHSCHPRLYTDTTTLLLFNFFFFQAAPANTPDLRMIMILVLIVSLPHMSVICFLFFFGFLSSSLIATIFLPSTRGLRRGRGEEQGRQCGILVQGGRGEDGYWQFEDQ